MSSPSSCCDPCALPLVVSTPGLEGLQGLAGTDGVSGTSAFTFTTDIAPLPNMPASGGSVIVTVASSDWMIPGQPVFVQGIGMMQVVSVVDGTHVQLLNLGYSGNAALGTPIISGSQISSGGFQPSVTGFASNGVNSDITELTGLTTPLAINEGGTAATTATNARTNFGFKSNANIADVVANAADTYLTGSALLVPTAGLKAGTVARWRFFLTKTAAGVVAPIWSVRVGVAGTTADTARLTFTGPAQTAAADTGEVEIVAILRNIGAAGVLAGGLAMIHHLETTGFANQTKVVLQVTSAGFDTTPGSLILGVSVDPGAAGVFTFQLVRGELYLNN